MLSQDSICMNAELAVPDFGLYAGCYCFSSSHEANAAGQDSGTTGLWPSSVFGLSSATRYDICA